MNLSEFFRRAFHPTSKTTSVRNMQRTPPAVAQAAETSRQCPALPVSSTTPTNATALPTASSASNTTTQTVSTQPPSNQNSHLPRSQHTWNGSASATTAPARSPTVPIQAHGQASSGQRRTPHNPTNDPASVVTLPVTNANRDGNGPRQSTARAPTTRSITVNWRSAVTNSFGPNATRKLPGKGTCPESYSAYCLEWEKLRKWLLETFAGWEFSEQPRTIKYIDHDRYHFTTPRPLTQEERDEIYKLRWDYDPDKETAA